MTRIGIQRLTGEEIEILSPEQARQIEGAGVTFTVWPYPTYNSTVIYRPTPFAYGPYGAFGAYGYTPAVVYPTYSSGWYYGW
jgi:hypothetical protein